MSTEQPSPERILQAAVKLFLEQSVRKTSAEEVAFQAGVTRVTVYRRFTDKQGLVCAVCSRIASIFQRAAADSRGRSIDEIDACLNQLGHQVARRRRFHWDGVYDNRLRLVDDPASEVHAGDAVVVSGAVRVLGGDESEIRARL